MSERPDAGHPSQPELLVRYLERERDHLTRALEGLSDHDVRRPLTPSGTSLLGLVPWWPENRRSTTLGFLAVHLLAEVAHHAGHADILRESIDGRGGSDQAGAGDAEWWRALVAKIQAEADSHR